MVEIFALAYGVLPCAALVGAFAYCGHPSCVVSKPKVLLAGAWSWAMLIAGAGLF